MNSFHHPLMLSFSLLNCSLVESLCRDAKRQPRDSNILLWVLNDTFSLSAYNRVNIKLRKMCDCLTLRTIESHIREIRARSRLHFEESNVLVNIRIQGNAIHTVHSSLIHVADGKTHTVFSPPIGSAAGIFVTLFVLGRHHP
jgi:hypothetical protein